MNTMRSGRGERARDKTPLSMVLVAGAAVFAAACGGAVPARSQPAPEYERYELPPWSPDGAPNAGSPGDAASAADPGSPSEPAPSSEGAPSAEAAPTPSEAAPIPEAPPPTPEAPPAASAPGTVPPAPVARP